jgi:acylphosphatase
MKARTLRIYGQVQGIGYRAWTVRTATEMGLRGWVRNRTDGSVEALLIGKEEKVEAMITACRNGPPLVQVTDIQAAEAEPEVLPGFEQRPTL